MQVRRYDNDPHSYAQPKGVRPFAEQAGASRSTSESSRNPASTSKTETSDSRFTALSSRLKEIPTVRANAIEAAREKLARGEYTTRQAAQQLAASMSQTEIF